MSDTTHLLQNLIPSENLFPVVGVGASAGGLDAFKDLISNIPVNSGIAYIFVQHLSPKYESVLTHILQKVSLVPVVEIIDEIKIKPDHVYIIPSNKLLIANDGRLDLHTRDGYERENIIDLFFSSLAEIHQEFSIGVVLSGTGNDGTIGLKTIKDQGGITIAQNDNAAYNAMPGGAIEAGVVDYILKPSEIPRHLVGLTANLKNAPNPTLPGQAEEQDQLIRKILALLKGLRDADFTYYKQTTIIRRIFRRVSIKRLTSLKEYLNLLSYNKQ